MLVHLLYVCLVVDHDGHDGQFATVLVAVPLVLSLVVWPKQALLAPRTQSTGSQYTFGIICL